MQHRHTIILPALFECKKTVKHKNEQEFANIFLQSKLFTGLVDLPEDGLKAEDKAAKAEALWVGPPWFAWDLSWNSNSKEC